MLLVLAGVVGFLLFTLIRIKKSDYYALANNMADRTRRSLEVLKPCPLCGELLRKGETVHTHVFNKGAKTKPDDTLVHMFGCKYCRPPNAKKARICPVCRKTVPDDGYIVARMFNREKRKHVHVLGCTECRKNSRRSSRKDYADS
ncbi:MAG: hypothetical protein EA426_07455 [Spirochaetaceae bacterium]|nr:MAG: hypothetical protein EA426_07455 [Spirochaetaceae bacterium]